MAANSPARGKQSRQHSSVMNATIGVRAISIQLSRVSSARGEGGSGGFSAGFEFTVACSERSMCWLRRGGRGHGGSVVLLPVENPVERGQDEQGEQRGAEDSADDDGG